MSQDEGFQPEPGKPALRRTVIRPAGSPVEACDAAHAANRLTTLAHELANLLDGSLRCLGMARRSAQETRPTTPGELSQRLDTVHAALVQMVDLVRTFSSSQDGRVIGPAPGAQTRLFLEVGCASLSDAVRHAAEVMRPLAEERGIALKIDLDRELDSVQSSSMYRVVADAIRNSVEAIQRVRDNRGGTITVTGRCEGPRTAGRVVLEVCDDGAGPSLGPGERGLYFDFGFTTKAGGSGIGLAIAKEVVQELGGTITLRARDERSKTGRIGAVLHIAFPARYLDTVGRGGAGEVA